MSNRLEEIRKRCDEYRELSDTNMFQDACDRVYLLDLLDRAEARLAGIGECICPKCGLRHGVSSNTAEF